MNSTLPVHMEACYDQGLLEEAAKCYMRRFFEGRGRWLLAACVVNVLGFGAALALGAKFDLIMVWVAFVVVVGPLYCAYLYFLFPRRYASRVARFLAPTAHISFTESAFEFSAKDRVVTVPWSQIKAVWECPVGFLLVFSQFVPSFTVVPKNGLPTSTHEFLDAKVREVVG
ncbi:MAG: hypothetical protein A3I02_06605 [Betaproteobacteria bacterium RIFCSPLOWO2_02_FULL_67_26]|nr:MAG: hypothetical protein A3I02_06605 [Betaproteobacteria bacterium RIFCSPLOWO2_02_FULL_67_26]